MSDPQASLDRQSCARHLLQHPLTCAERHGEAFRLIRRHEQELDRWFTQRLGYRLHVTADTARLFKSTVVSDRRPLRTATSKPRPFTKREYVLLCLVLAAVAAGPRVISLRDLIDRIRTAAVDAAVTLSEAPSERRALVSAVQWMIELGLIRELHERVEQYAIDEAADAVLEVFPDRVALLPLPSLMRSESAGDVMDRSHRRGATRQWMRARLVEDPVLYRSDLDEDEWRELRRRLGQEADLLQEMFGLVLEARAEGVAAIDPRGDLSDRRFPTSGTIGHAALLLLERLTEPTPSAAEISPPDVSPAVDTDGAASEDRAASEEPVVFVGRVVSEDRVVEILTELASEHRSHWSKLADEPEKLAGPTLELLVDHRLVDIGSDGVQVLPLAYRYTAVESTADGSDQPGQGKGGSTPHPDGDQARLW